MDITDDDQERHLAHTIRLGEAKVMRKYERGRRCRSLIELVVVKVSLLFEYLSFRVQLGFVRGLCWLASE